MPISLSVCHGCVKSNIIFVSKYFYHQGPGPCSLHGLTLVLASRPLEGSGLTCKSAVPGEHRLHCLSTTFTSFYLIA